MDRFFRKPTENPLQGKMDSLKQRDGTILELNADIKRLNEKLDEIDKLDITGAEHAQDDHFNKTGEHVTMEEIRDKYFEQLQHLKKLRGKVREGVHGFLVQETDVMDPDKRK